MTSAKQIQTELRPQARELRKLIPDVYRGFASLHDAALAEGTLSTKTKELMALAIAVSTECDGCIVAHAHAAVLHGATSQEAAEAIGVSILMSGGPATIYGPRALAAVQEFLADHPQEATAHSHA